MNDRPRPEPERCDTAPRPTIGGPFNPCREICGFYPPDIVARQPRQVGLTEGQKRLYERAVRWAGRNGRIWYGFDTIAKELGKSSRQVKRDMAVLEALGLIEHVRRGKRQSNVYRFLYHPMFESEVTSASSHPRGEVTDLSSEVTSTSLGEVTPASLESCKENYVRESSSERVESCAGSQVTAEGRIDDDPLFHEKEKTNPEAMLELIGSGVGFGDADPLMGVGPLPRKFLESAALSIHASKCNTGFGGVDLDLYPPPDIRITTRIVEPWRGKGTVAFVDWVCSTMERQLGRKARAGGAMVYGLFLADSEASARTWESGRLLSTKLSQTIFIQKQQAEQRIADERHRQLMETPVLLADAIRILNSEVRDWKAAVSPRFLWLMDRKVNEISPAELLADAIAWRSCRRCGDSGIGGSPLKGTLSFCDCGIGQQEHLDRGDVYIAGEIEHVNATLKSRLVRACRELKHDFTGDAIAQNDTTVTEHDDLIEICPGVGAENWCDQQDLRQALEYLGDTRRVRVGRVRTITPQLPPPPTPPITREDIDRIAAEHRRQAPARREPASAQSLDSQSNTTAAGWRR